MNKRVSNSLLQRAKLISVFRFKILPMKKTKVKPKFNGYNGFPEPKEVKCFDCGKNFLVKFVISRLAYSQKNN